MTQIIQFLARFAVWFYIAAAFSLVILLGIYLRAQREIQQALFGLELEIGKARRDRASRLMILVICLAATVFVVAVFVEPSLPDSMRARPLPTPDIFSTPPPTFTNETPTATATMTATLSVETVTPEFNVPVETNAEGEETLEPSATPPTAPVGVACIISNPAEGSTISGEVAFEGTASAEDFFFFKLEAYGPETSEAWASILGDVVYSPVQNGLLGIVNFAGWTPGGYSIRLVIVDNTRNEVSSCYLSLNIAAP